jgi:alkylation response protein AidB-like acyl-CoA dehydrogenase
MVSSRCVGAAQRLVDETTAFARDRIVDGKPLGEHHLVAGILADSATELFAARSLLYEVARGIDAGLDRKALHGHSEMAGRVADRTVQIFGGPQAVLEPRV